jgi:hypothetical protein
VGGSNRIRPQIFVTKQRSANETNEKALDSLNSCFVSSAEYLLGRDPDWDSCERIPAMGFSCCSSREEGGAIFIL